MPLLSRFEIAPLNLAKSIPREVQDWYEKNNGACRCRALLFLTYFLIWLPNEYFARNGLNLITWLTVKQIIATTNVTAVTTVICWTV